jgi:hypothetical protein
MYSPRVCQFSVYEINKLKRKNLFWLMVSEVLVHGQLTSLLWACGEERHHGSGSI